jgi:hypothetical protein
MVRRVESSEDGICVMWASKRRLLKAEDTAAEEREQTEASSIEKEERVEGGGQKDHREG